MCCGQARAAEQRIAQPASVAAGVALVTGLANWLYIEPVATDLMFERYALENADGERDGAKIKALYKQFGASPTRLTLYCHGRR